MALSNGTLVPYVPSLPFGSSPAIPAKRPTGEAKFSTRRYRRGRSVPEHVRTAQSEQREIMGMDGFVFFTEE